MKPYAQPVSHDRIQAAIDDVLAGGDGAMLEGDDALGVEAAHELATQYLREKGDDAKRVRLSTNGSWLRVEPAEASAKRSKYLRRGVLEVEPDGEGCWRLSFLPYATSKRETAAAAHCRADAEQPPDGPDFTDPDRLMEWGVARYGGA